MKRLIVNVTLVAFLGAVSAETAAAQSAGAGGILDWIHKLSGPMVIGVGVSGYSSLVKNRESTTIVRGRFTVVGRTTIAEAGEVTPASANILMLSLQPSLEFPVIRFNGVGSVDLAPGFALHNFFGDADSFWHYSIPVYAQARIPLSTNTLLRLGVGIHYFPKWGTDDFMPLAVTVPLDGSELVLAAYGGFDFRLAR